MPRLEIRSIASHQLVSTTAQALSQALSPFLQQSGCLLGLSGGSWAQVYQATLPLLPKNLETLDLILADERFGPLHHAHSNAFLLQSCIDQFLSRGARFHPLLLTDQSLVAAQQRAIESYQPLLASLPLVLTVGIGEDGHTLSWFPRPSLTEYLVVYDHPDPVLAITHQSSAVCPDRLTLSPAAVAEAAAVIGFCQGPTKHSVVSALASTPPPLHRLPAVYLSTLCCPSVVYTDSL